MVVVFHCHCSCQLLFCLEKPPWILLTTNPSIWGNRRSCHVLTKYRCFTADFYLVSFVIVTKSFVSKWDTDFMAVRADSKYCTSYINLLSFIRTRNRRRINSATVVMAKKKYGDCVYYLSLRGMERLTNRSECLTYHADKSMQGLTFN